MQILVYSYMLQTLLHDTCSMGVGVHRLLSGHSTVLVACNVLLLWLLPRKRQCPARSRLFSCSPQQSQPVRTAPHSPEHRERMV